MIVDVVLVLLLIISAVRGWHRGFVVRALQLVGLFGAGALAYILLPMLLAHIPTLSRPSIARSVVLIAGVWVAALGGEALLSMLGVRLMSGGHRVVNRGDAVAGALASVVATTLVTWFLVSAIEPSLPTGLAAEISGSRILTAVDRAMPEPPRRWAADLATSINTSRFPDVFSGLSPEPNPSVAAPDTGITAEPAVVRAAASVVKVLASSRSCGGSEGSGWVVSAHRVVTNAHVVGGATTVVVQVRGAGAYLRATVVAFDPHVDLAILDVPGLGAPALTRSGPLTSGESAVVAGYPLDGGYRAVAARVRDEIRATGRDIYSTGLVTRDVYSLYATVEPGNCGNWRAP